MVMGTATTMACLTEALGLMLPGGATAPSGSGARLRHAVATGRVLRRASPTRWGLAALPGFGAALRQLRQRYRSVHAVVQSAGGPRRRVANGIRKLPEAAHLQDRAFFHAALTAVGVLQHRAGVDGTLAQLLVAAAQSRCSSLMGSSSNR